MKEHVPILVKEILEMIPEHSTTLVDGTFGHAGHSISILKHTINKASQDITLWCFDKDQEVLQYGKQRLFEEFPKFKDSPQIKIFNKSYTELKDHLQAHSVNFILLDLGINRAHVTSDERGFSFQGDGPLDMRFDTTQGFTAYQIIKASTLEDIKGRLMDFGDFSDKRSSRIAQIINKHKADKRLETTLGLVDILKEVGIRRAELAPLFQSIRITTNDEFGEINKFFSHLDNLLAVGGRCAILSFHSIEDRLIKKYFKELEKNNGYHILTKKPITPSSQEVLYNRASRSAKLRVIEKTQDEIL